MNNYMYKRVLSPLLATAMLTGVMGCGASDTAEYTSVSTSNVSVDNTGNAPTTLTASGKGYAGEFEVTVSMNGSEISDVKVGENSETVGIGSAAIDKLPSEIVAAQSVAIDLVSGATVTSTAIVSAVTEALTAAGLDINNYSKAIDVVREDVTLETDVVVVGSGMAGLTAAIDLAEAGKDVIVLEYLSVPGGNASMAEGIIFGVESDAQIRDGYEDNVEKAVNDWKVYQSNVEMPSENFPDYDRVTKMIEDSAGSTAWFEDRGFELEVIAGTLFGGGAEKENRMHVSPYGEGDYMVDFMVELAESLGVTIYLESPGSELIEENGVITGVISESKTGTKTIKADSVILATGGFLKNQELIERLIPDFAPYAGYTAGSAGNTGDGITMAEAVGAALDEEYWMFTADVWCMDWDLNPIEALGAHAMVNGKGERFMDESTPLGADYGVAIFEVIREDSGIYMVFDSSEFYKEHVALTEENLDDATVFKADTIEELAAAIGIDPAGLTNTLANYGTGEDEFNKDSALVSTISEGPFYAAEISIITTKTVGGLITDLDQRVLKDNGDVIEGLYATGELVIRPYFDKLGISGASILQAVHTSHYAAAHILENK